jgi:hypothetical protein
VGREVLDAAHKAVRPGVTTDEIDRVVSGRWGHTSVLKLKLLRARFLGTCVGPENGKRRLGRGGALHSSPAFPGQRERRPRAQQRLVFRMLFCQVHLAGYLRCLTHTQQFDTRARAIQQ